MKKLLFFLFVSCSFYVSKVNAQDYDYSQKIDVEAEIQITNLNDIYNQVGMRYIGYGYYSCVEIISERSRRSRSGCNARTIDIQGTIIDTVGEREYRFTDNGSRKTVRKTIYFQKAFWNHYPLIKKYEAIKIIKENKELLELGLLTQERYDDELKKIKYVLNNY